MKRRLLILAICLLLGAVVNVAVAWGCAAFVNSLGDAGTALAFRATGQRTWELLRVERLGLTCFMSTHGWLAEPIDFDFPPHGPSPETLLPSWNDLAAPTPDFFAAIESKVDDLIVEKRDLYCSGWPLRSVWCDWHVIRTSPATERLWRSRSAGGGGYIETSLAPWGGYLRRVLPLRPIWPGFAVNTIVYAAILWLLIPGPFALRRLLRVRRGLCPKCAYPMGESAVCSECGGALPKRVAT